MNCKTIHLLVFSLTWLASCIFGGDATELQNNQKYHIDGKVSVPYSPNSDWMADIRILIDGGEYLGFLKEDGSFSITNIPYGSYMIEIASPTYVFEPVRIDISSRGKIRARKLDHVQPGAVQQLSYPLKFKAKGMAPYFQQREQWRITDLLFNPMVLMMLLPCLMIMVLPKLVNSTDPETQKDLQSQMNMLNTKQNIPEISEMFTNFFGTGAKKPIKAKANKRKER